MSCVTDAARYQTAKWPNATCMFVFQHRSKRAETPLWMGSPHANELYYIFGVPFFNESTLIPWHGYRINHRYFGAEDFVLTLTSTPALRNALLSYQDTYILVYEDKIILLVDGIFLSF